MDEAVAGHLVLDEVEDQVGRRDRRLDAEQLEVLEVARVVAAGDDPLAEVLLLGDLADEDVVLVVAGDGHDEVGALDAGALEHPQLGAVAVLDGVLELLLDAQVGAAVVLDERDLLPVADELAGEVEPDLAAADDDDVHQAGRDLGDRLLEHRDAELRRRRSCAGPARRTSPSAPGRARAR